MNFKNLLIVSLGILLIGCSQYDNYDYTENEINFKTSDCEVSLFVNDSLHFDSVKGQILLTDENCDFVFIPKRTLKLTGFIRASKIAYPIDNFQKLTIENDQLVIKNGTKDIIVKGPNLKELKNKIEMKNS